MLTRIAEGQWIDLSLVTQIQTRLPQTGVLPSTAKVVVRWATGYSEVEFKTVKEAIAFADDLGEKAASTAGRRDRSQERELP